MGKKIAFQKKPEKHNREEELDNFVLGKEMPPAQAEPQKPIPQERMKRLTLDISESLHRRVKTRCAETGRNMADTLRDILEQNFPEEATAQK